jgi:uncharacterized protein YuzE
MQVIIQADRAADALYIGFGADSLAQGGVERSLRVNDDVTLDFDIEGRLVGLDVLNASRVFGEDYADIRLTSLVGVKEAAALVGVKKPNFLRDYVNDPDFPPPVVELASGRFWLSDQIEQYFARKPAKARH